MMDKNQLPEYIIEEVNKLVNGLPLPYPTWILPKRTFYDTARIFSGILNKEVRLFIKESTEMIGNYFTYLDNTSNRYGDGSYGRSGDEYHGINIEKGNIKYFDSESIFTYNMLEHEISHCLFPFIHQKSFNAVISKYGPSAKPILNICEDVRVDSLYGDMFPGFKIMGKTVNRLITEACLITMPEFGRNFQYINDVIITLIAQGTIRKKNDLEYDNFIELFIQVVLEDTENTAPVKQLIDTCVDLAMKCEGKGSLKSLNQTVKILELLNATAATNCNTNGIAGADGNTPMTRDGDPSDNEQVKEMVEKIAKKVRREIDEEDLRVKDEDEAKEEGEGVDGEGVEGEGEDGDEQSDEDVPEEEKEFDDLFDTDINNNENQSQRDELEEDEDEDDEDLDTMSEGIGSSLGEKGDTMPADSDSQSDMKDTSDIDTDIDDTQSSADGVGQGAGHGDVDEKEEPEEPQSLEDIAKECGAQNEAKERKKNEKIRKKVEEEFAQKSHEERKKMETKIEELLKPQELTESQLRSHINPKPDYARMIINKVRAAGRTGTGRIAYDEEGSEFDLSRKIESKNSDSKDYFVRVKNGIPDVKLVFLLDISGSMQGVKEEAMKRMVLSFYDAAKRLNKIECEAYAFDNSLFKFKNEEEISKVSCNGGTNLYSATASITYDLMKNKAAKQTIFIILTDGETGEDPLYIKGQKWTFKKMTQILAKHNIKTMYFYIQQRYSSYQSAAQQPQQRRSITRKEMNTEFRIGRNENSNDLVKTNAFQIPTEQVGEAFKIIMDDVSRYIR